MGHHFEETLPRLIWSRLVLIATAAMVTLCSAGARAEADASPGSAEIVLLAFGDSLTAGFQLPASKAFPAQLEAALRAKGYNVRIINAGVSGDTAADGLARLDWSFDGKVDGAIVELGANDALRGIDPKVAEASLDAILKALAAKRIEVLLAGMEAPRNWGEDYETAFRAIYPRIAAKYGALLYPFFLKDVVSVPSLNLPDGLHPTPEGVAIIVRNMLPDVEKLIARIQEKRISAADGEAQPVH